MRRITKILTASILAVSLFSGSVLSAFPAVAVEKTYTTKDLFSKILPDNATITISDLDDLNHLDTYIQTGMLNEDSNYTFRLENDIALSDYTFDRQNDSSKIAIYENQKPAAVYDEASETFYTDDSLQTVSDFSFQGKSWKPSGSRSFCASFDGNGHQITGLWSFPDTDSKQTAFGLFAGLSGARISNLTINGAFISADYDVSKNTANSSLGILSAVSSNSDIVNCSIQNAFISATDYQCVGALCGQSESDSFENVTVDASIRLHTNNTEDENAPHYQLISGACGMLTGTYTGQMLTAFVNSKASGHITDENSYFSVGGLCGKAESMIYMTNCTNSTEISSAGIAGGLVGSAAITPIQSDYRNSLPIYMNHVENTSSISGIYAGGIIGISYDKVFFELSMNEPFDMNYDTPLTVIIGGENSGPIRASSRGGGIIGQGAAPYLKDCSNHGTIVNIEKEASLDNLSSLIFSSEYGKLYTSQSTLITADLQNTQDQMASIGGLIGQCYCRTYIYNSYNDANLITRFAICGGLLGRVSEEYVAGLLSMENCFHSGQITQDQNGSDPAIQPIPNDNSDASPSSSPTPVIDRPAPSSDTQTLRPVLTASLIGYCCNLIYSRNIRYCYTTQSSLPLCGYWGYSILDGTPLSEDVSPVSPSECAVISTAQLTGSESSQTIGNDSYNSYPDLLSCLNAWIENKKNNERYYLSGYYYFSQEPSAWTEDSSHPVLSLQSVPDPRYSPLPVTMPPARTTTPDPSVVSPEPSISLSPSPETSSETSSETEQPAETSSAAETKPVLLKTTADRRGGIRIVWSCATLYDGYQIYRATSRNAAFRSIVSLNTSRRSKYFTQTTTAKNIRSTYIDVTAKPEQTYYYKIVPYNRHNSSNIYGTASDIGNATARLMAPVLTVRRKKNADGQRYLRIKLRRYQGRYADIYIRKNHKKYTLLQLRNDNIKQQKATFDLHYTFRKATIAVKVQTFHKKKRTNGSFYSKEIVLQIRE